MAAGLVMVGLWPFAFQPPNRASWLKDRAGLSFQPDGIAYDPEPANWSAAGQPQQPAAFTVELWLEPDQVPVTDLFYILTIDDGQIPSGIVLCQWKTELLLRVRDRAHVRGFGEVGPAGVLIERKPCFITVTVDSSGTAFFLNGSSVKHFADFVMPRSYLNGRLVLGNSVTGKHPWTGNLYGLAIFNRALAASEVAQHQALWTGHQPECLAGESGLAALYLFDEGSGQWAQDRSPNRHRLLIPERYRCAPKARAERRGDRRR